MKHLIVFTLLMGIFFQRAEAQLCVMTPNQFANPWAPTYKGSPDTVMIAGHQVRNIGTSDIHPKKVIFELEAYTSSMQPYASDTITFTLPLMITINGIPYERQITLGQRPSVDLPDSITLPPGQPGQVSEIPIRVSTTFAQLPEDVYMIRIFTEVRSIWMGYPAVHIGASPYMYNIQAFTAKPLMPDAYLEPCGDSALVLLDKVRFENHAPLLSQYQGANLWNIYVSLEGSVGGYPPLLSGTYVVQDSLGNYLPIDSVRIDQANNVAKISISPYEAPHIGVDSSITVTVSKMMPPTSAGDSVTNFVRGGIRLFSPPGGWQPNTLTTSSPQEPSRGRTLHIGNAPTTLLEQAAPTVSVYSNPDASTITVNSAKEAMVEIHGMNGSLAGSWKTIGDKTTTIQLPPGIYTVTVTNANGITVRKLVR